MTNLLHIKYRPDIDGLRAIAVILVVLFHTFPKLVPSGFIGVDIFFVISGYLISTIIINNLENDKFSFLEFYGRRIRRIFPALIIVLIFCIILGWFALFPTEYKYLGKHLVGGSGFISNFLFWKESSYFSDAAETKILLHLWSLSIEEQFYILWPFFLWMAYRKKFNLLTLTILITSLSFILNIYEIKNDPTLTFYSPQTRFFEILLGSILAYLNIKQKIKINDKLLNNIKSVFGLLLIIVGLLLIKKEIFPGWWALLPTLGTVLIISAGPRSWINFHLLSNKILVWFGLISFPLYLWHWPILSFIHIIEGGTAKASVRVVGVLISILLAWLTFNFIEKPIRNKYPNKATIFLLIILMIIICLFGGLLFKTDGFKNRTQNESKPIEQFVGFPHVPFHNKECEEIFPLLHKAFDACLLSKKEPPSILLLGDSHSNQYYKSLAKILNKTSILNIATWSCLPFSSPGHPSHKNGFCQEKINLALSFLSKQTSLKTILLAGHWSYLSSGGFGKSGVDWRIPSPLKKEEALSFIKLGNQVISNLMLTKKEIILMLDAPDLSFDPKSCVFVRPIHIFPKKIKSPCAIPRKEYEFRMASYNQALFEILNQFPKIKIFDPKSVFCDKDFCWGLKENNLLYFDGDHLSLYGTDLVINQLIWKFPNLEQQ